MSKYGPVGTLTMTVSPKLAHMIPPRGLGMWDLRWVVILLMVLAILYGVAVELSRLRWLRRARLEDIDRMDGRACARYLARLFRGLGYRAHLYRRFGAGRFNLVVTGYGARGLVLCPPFRHALSAEAVEALAGTFQAGDFAVVMLVVPHRLAPTAEATAQRHGIELWAPAQLAARMVQATQASVAEARLVVTRAHG